MKSYMSNFYIRFYKMIRFSTFKIFLGVILFIGIIVSDIYGKSYYLFENFSGNTTNNAGWIFNFPMSRDLVVYDTHSYDQDWPGGTEVSNSQLFIFGRGNNGDLMWNNWYVGDGIVFDPKSNSTLGQITATPEEPFGYVIYRYVTSIDAKNGPAFTAGYNDEYELGYIGAWLVEDSGAKTTNDYWQNFIYFYDKSRFNQNNTFGYFYNLDYDVSFASLSADIDGKTTGDLATFFQKNMDNNNTANNNSTKYSTAYFNPVTQPLGIKLVTDGSKVSIYINPNPTNAAVALSNTWIKVTERSASIANNLIAYFSTETCFFRSEAQEAQFDNFLIRTVTSNIVASISPQKVVTNALVNFTVVLTNFMGSINDSGIGEIILKKPSSYVSNWILSSFSVSNEYGNLSITNANVNPPAGYASVSTNSSGEVIIRFNMTSGSANQILTNNGGVARISFNLYTPSSPNSSGENFEVFADCVKHADTGQDWVFYPAGGIKYATTGRKKARPVSDEALLVRTYIAPTAYAMLSAPESVVVGKEESAFNFILSTEGLSGTPNISYVRIYIPSGFTVSNNSGITNIISMALGGLSYQSCYLTNINGSNFVFINYMPIGGFPGVGGWDKISFNEYGTPAIPGGIYYTNFLWQVDINSSAIIGGTGWQNALTNATYNRQTIRVVMSNAQVNAYINPQAAAINTTLESNKNLYYYHIENVGPVNNNVYGIYISVPGDFLFSSVSNVLSSNGSVTLSNNSIWVSYASPLTTGQKDRIQFYATHTNTNVNSPSQFAPFICYADNNNSLGYTLQKETPGQSWSVEIKPPVPTAENQIFIPVTNISGTNTNTSMNPVLYTSDITNTIVHNIYNTSARGVNIKLVAIYMSTNYIVSVNNVNSTLADSHYSVVNTNGSNVIYLKYFENNTNLLSRDEDSGAMDTVSFSIVDRISYNTFPIMPTNITMPVIVYKTTNESTNSQDYNISTIGIRFSGTNKVYVEFPPVDLAYYVQPNEIDATSITNSITYFVTNRGKSGNRIHSIMISIPTNVSTNIVGLNMGSFNTTSNRIEVLYPTPLDGGQSSTVTFQMIDIVDNKDVKDIYLYPWVSNDRSRVQVSNVVDGMSGKLDILLPKPKGGGGVSPNVFFVNLNEGVNSVITQNFVVKVTNTGSGTDRFNSVKVMLPDILNSKVQTVYSTKLNLSNQTSPAVVKLNSTNFEVVYSNASQYISAGGSDTIVVTALVSNLQSLPTNGEWKFYADNGAVLKDFPNPDITYFEITNVILGSKVIYGTERPEVSQDGDTLTTAITNTFTYTVYNGSTANGRAISKARIRIPWPYTRVISLLNTGGQSATLSTNSNYIWLNYAGPTYLSSGNNTTIEIKAIKQILSEPTNATWSCDVYYADNIEEIPVSNLRGNPDQLIVLPTAYFYAYVTPNSIGKDEVFATYTFVITNYGEFGNNLYKVKIVPPTTNTNTMLVMTNIDNITSVLAGTNSFYSNDGCVYIDYGANNTNIVSGGIDTITLRAYDNQESIGFTGKWSVYAANSRTSAPNILTSDPEIGIGKSLGLTFVMPDYDSVYYVIPNEVSTINASNTFRVVLENVGSGTNNINYAKIYLPSPLLTNSILITSSNGATVSLSNENGTNIAILQYTVNTFVTNKLDTITITAKDDIEYGDTNAFIKVFVRYNTSALTYVPSRVKSGFTNELSFIMPPPSVSAFLLSDNIYTVQRNASLKFRVINSAIGNHDVKRVRLYVNSGFTNGLNLSKLTDPMATNITYNSSTGVYEMNYSNFVMQATNNITLEVTNTNTQKLRNIDFGFEIDNGVRTTNITVYLNVETPPVAGLVTKEIETPNYSNYVKLNFFNYTSGSSPVYYCKVNVPNLFTNIINPISSRGTIISNNKSNFTIYYEGGLPKADYDTIELWVVDSNDMVEISNVQWILQADNLNGMANVEENQSNSLLMNMIIPLPSVSNIVYTKWFAINVGTTVLTNQFIMKISNTGQGANSIFSNKIELPAELSTVIVSSLSNTKNLSKLSYSTGIITVEYTNSTGLFPGEGDEISFKFTNTVTSSKDVYITIKSFNGSFKGYASGIDIINFISPQEPTEAFVYNSQILYSIDHSAIIKYQVNNGMYDKGITDIRIGFDTTRLNITNIYSSLLGQNLSYVATSSNITIHYSPMLPPKPRAGSGASNEIIYIYVTYTNNDNWTNDMKSEVLYEGGYEYSTTSVKPGETDKLPVLVADFGRIVGIVLPGSANPTVKLLYSGSNAIVTNKFGQQITAGGDTATGEYVLDFVPPGTYDVSFVGALYKESRYTNVVAVANVITNIGTCKMHRDLFDKDSTTVQSTISLDDTNSFVVVPVGTLGENFAVDVWITNLYVVSEMRDKLNSGFIAMPRSPELVRVYQLDISGVSVDYRTEQELKNDVIITLHYEDAEIAAQGWSEDKLAIYYWREMTKEWVRIGGKVDTVRNTVSAKVSYLHKYYAIFGESQISPKKPGFVSVKTDPKVFTPKAGDRAYKNIKISIGFEESQERYQVKIFDLRGNLIRSFDRSGEYKQGEVYWDGKDEEGYDVKTGVYIYRVIAGSNVFSGTIVVVR